MDYYDYNYTMFINYYLRVVLLCVLLFEFHSHLENKSRVNTLSGWYDEIQKKDYFWGCGLNKWSEKWNTYTRNNITCEEEIIYQSQFCGETRMKLKLQLC